MFSLIFMCSLCHMAALVKITSTDNLIIKMEKLLVIWVIMGLYYISYRKKIKFS